MDEGIALGLNGQLDKGHIGLSGGAASFPDVAICAGADDVFPGGFSADTAGDNVVEGEFAGGEFFAAILAGVSVAGEEVSAVEFDVVSWEAVVEEQPDDFGDGDVEINGRDPVVQLRFEASF